MNRIQLHFQSAVIDPAVIQRTGDNAIVLNAAPMAVGDYEYYGFEQDQFMDRGFAWDAKLVGRVEQAEAERILPQFEGLPVTDDHVWVETGQRATNAVGTVLQPGTLDGQLVNTRVVVHDPTAIVKITSGEAVELSIGFWNIIRWNENKAEGEPDFFVESIDLNHVAVVKEGRAGPDARLSNHRAKLERDQKMKTITINSVAMEVSDEFAAEYEAQQAAQSESVTALNNSVATLTTERDTAVGGLAAAKTASENAKKKAGEDAVKLAQEHADFIEQAAKMGHATADLTLGDYDADAIRREILENKGMKLEKDVSADVVRGAWLHALSDLGDKPAPKSILDDTAPEKIETSNASIRQRAEDATRQSYFGGAKKPAKKEA